MYYMGANLFITIIIKTNHVFTEARDNEWQWHQLGNTPLCIQNHASTPPLSFLQDGCPSCHPTNSVKALKANHTVTKFNRIVKNMFLHGPRYSLSL